MRKVTIRRLNSAGKTISGTRLIVKFVLANPLTAFTSGYLNKLYCTS